MSIKATTSKNIRRFREAAGLTRADLAKRSKLHVTYIARIENRPANLTLENLEKIAKALKCHAGDLIGCHAIAVNSVDAVKRKLEQASRLISEARDSIEEPG